MNPKKEEKQRRKDALKEAFEDFKLLTLPSKQDLKEMALAIGYVLFIYLLFGIASLFL